eukprot:1594701-Rhodomonas_salina.1
MSMLTHNSFLSPPTHIQTKTNCFAHTHLHTKTHLLNKFVQHLCLCSSASKAHHTALHFPTSLHCNFVPNHPPQSHKCRKAHSGTHIHKHPHTHTHNRVRLGSGRGDRLRVGRPEARPRVARPEAEARGDSCTGLRQNLQPRPDMVVQRQGVACLG